MFKIPLPDDAKNALDAIDEMCDETLNHLAAIRKLLERLVEIEEIKFDRDAAS